MRRFLEILTIVLVVVMSLLVGRSQHGLAFGLPTATSGSNGFAGSKPNRPTATPTTAPALKSPTAVPTATRTPTPLPTGTAVTPTATSVSPGNPALAAGTIVARDTFSGRTASGGWGTASDGSTWTVRSGSASILSVSGNEGRVVGSGTSPEDAITIGSTPLQDAEAVARYSTGGFVDDNGRIILRWNDANNYYAAGFASPSGSELDVYKWSNGVRTRLCGSAFAATNGTFYWERVRITTSGSSAIITVKAWQDGTSEPASPQVTCTDSSPLGAGNVGINAWDGGVGWSMDNFSAGSLAGLATPTPSPSSLPSATPTPTSTSGITAVIAAAGDISCAPGDTTTSTSCQQAATSNLLAKGNYNAVLALGDDQYDSGALAEFEGSYDPTWGRLKSITHPVPGNHEYNTSGAAGYFSYFGSGAGNPSQGYYSFDIGGWHMIALNSNCGSIGGCQAGSAEEKWLKSDLASHSNLCTLAYYHHPRWSSGEEGDKLQMADIWTDLANAHVDLVLSGHDHDYERFGPQDANGNASSTGTREFIVGTGGENHSFFYQVQPNSEVRDDQTFGVLQLTLHSNGYDWQFLPIAGQTFTDSGSGTCH